MVLGGRKGNTVYSSTQMTDRFQGKIQSGYRQR